jgi:hypothetical protein
LRVSRRLSKPFFNIWYWSWSHGGCGFLARNLVPLLNTEENTFFASTISSGVSVDRVYFVLNVTRIISSSSSFSNSCKRTISPSSIFGTFIVSSIAFISSFTSSTLIFSEAAVAFFSAAVAAAGERTAATAGERTAAARGAAAGDRERGGARGALGGRAV